MAVRQCSCELLYPCYFTCVALHYNSCVVCVRVVCIGYLLSCSVDHLTSLMGITPLIIVPLMLFGGYYLNSESVFASSVA